MARAGIWFLGVKVVFAIRRYKGCNGPDHRQSKEHNDSVSRSHSNSEGSVTKRFGELHSERCDSPSKTTPKVLYTTYKISIDTSTDVLVM